MRTQCHNYRPDLFIEGIVKVFVPVKKLERNSQVCFYKLLVAIGLKRSTVHGVMHVQSCKVKAV